MGPYNSDMVASAIRDAVARPGWSQTRLAAAVGVRPQTVNKWVKGENTPPVDRLPAIEKALGLDEGTLVRLRLPVSITPTPAAASGIDISDLPAEDQQLIKEHIEFLRARRAKS